MGTRRASWEYAERFVAEDAPLQAARRRAEEVGCVPIQPGGGAALRLLAAAVGAKSVIEVGTGTGVSGLWLLRGMVPDGILTSIDIESEHQRMAKLAFEEAGFPPARVRLIHGDAMAVLPRFNEGGYDLVFIDGAKGEYPGYLEAGLRLLRPGGVVCLDNALWHDRVADPDVADGDTMTLRRVLAGVIADEDLVPALLPVGDGLLAAVKR